MSNGGYDDGYLACPCFWGDAPSKFVRIFLDGHPDGRGKSALDLGCGEGKNAAALARAGYRVTAVDCSAAALANATRHWNLENVVWLQARAEQFVASCPMYDVIVMYGLLHCFESAVEIGSVVRAALTKTRINGIHIVACFNDGPHDLSAHPGLKPTLLPHNFFLGLYAHQRIIASERELVHETHPHNRIPHFHSISRILAARAQ